MALHENEARCAENDVPQPHGRPQGGMKSDAGRAAYWRMQYESAIGALADLIAEHTETVEELDRLRPDATIPAEAWPLGDQDGYSIRLCTCEEGPYLGARQMGTVCRCERCGFMTPDQWRHIATRVTPPASTVGVNS